MGMQAKEGEAEWSDVDGSTDSTWNSEAQVGAGGVGSMDSDAAAFVFMCLHVGFMLVVLVAFRYRSWVSPRKCPTCHCSL